HDPTPFKGRRTKRVLVVGILGLAVLAAIPFRWPEMSLATERLATLLSLVFLIAAIGLWLGMGVRSFAVAVAMVLALYGATFWTRLAYDLADFFVVAVIVGFAIFALAGFNLVFVIEEMVHDLHRDLRLRGRAWTAAPTVAVLAIAAGLPWWRLQGGPSLPSLWIASVLGGLVLLGWWFVRALNDVPGGERILRELHLFVIGALAASGLADAVAYVRAGASLLPSLIGYAALLGTWFYVTYTSLQRAHFLLRGNNALPWLAILLGASFAVLAHVQVLFRAGGSRAVADLADERALYLVAGVWIGIGFYVLRALSDLLRLALRSGGVRTTAGRTVATGGARVAEGLLHTPEALEEAAFQLFRRMDELLPGQHRPPQRRGWAVEPHGEVKPLEGEESQPPGGGGAG
ncbi:MAG TPA: hypothetical protein VI796_03650, partial [Candidatus Thermoplasmatota archaeon]|nr:hypothetical protein [Candidatus Thermoplasmatota archaeon]